MSLNMFDGRAQIIDGVEGIDIPSHVSCETSESVYLAVMVKEGYFGGFQPDNSLVTHVDLQFFKNGFAFFHDHSVVFDEALGEMSGKECIVIFFENFLYGFNPTEIEEVEVCARESGKAVFFEK